MPRWNKFSIKITYFFASRQSRLSFLVISSTRNISTDIIIIIDETASTAEYRTTKEHHTGWWWVFTCHGPYISCFPSKQRILNMETLVMRCQCNCNKNLKAIACTLCDKIYVHVVIVITSLVYGDSQTQLLIFLLRIYHLIRLLIVCSYNEICT